MKKTYDFTNLKELPEDFTYAYSLLPKEHKKFIFTEEATLNYEPNMSFENTTCSDYDYISIISKKKYKSGTKVNIKCSFGKFGAPLFVFGNDLSPNEDGSWQYGLHFEVVAYERGMNVWHILPFPERKDRPIRPFKAGFQDFAIAPDELIDMTVEIKGHWLHINVNGHEYTCPDPEFPESFHVGYTACEGPNKLYSITIDDAEE